MHRRGLMSDDVVKTCGAYYAGTLIGYKPAERWFN